MWIVTLPSSPDGDAIRAALKGHFDAVNAGGGIFGRRIRLTEDEEPFAIVAAHVSGREREVGKLVAQKRIPTIAAFSTRGDDANRYLFHLLAGIEEQSLALIGNEKLVGEQLSELADAGVTDFAAAVYGAPEERDRTISLLSTARRPD